MKKRVWVPVVVLLVGAAVGGYGWMGMKRRQAAADEVILPDFSELPAGPRAPSTGGFGAAVGRSTLAEIEAYAKAHGLDCKDTSARALMKDMRARKAKEKEDAEARGDKVDTVTKASSGKKSPMEKNPQVRLSCEGTKSVQLGDRERPEATGRVLYIFDSPTHPLRHASYRRQQKNMSLGYEDMRAAYDAMRAKFGEPTTSTKPLPEPEEGADLAVLFPSYEPFNYQWVYADVVATVTLINYGARGFDVYEAIEVPWPVRSDAPTLSAVSTAPQAKATETP